MLLTPSSRKEPDPSLPIGLKLGKINLLLSLASVRLKKSSHRTLIEQMEKEKHTSSFLNKDGFYQVVWMSLLSAHPVLCGEDAESPQLHQSPIQSRVWMALPLRMVTPRPSQNLNQWWYWPQVNSLASSGCEQASLEISNPLEKVSHLLSCGGSPFGFRASFTPILRLHLHSLL